VPDAPPASDPRHRLGRRAEALARDHLTAAGLVVVAHNWRCRHGEIDLVATAPVFCEVKARRSDAYGTPAAAVTARKQARLRALAAAWLAAADHPPSRVRFDVVTVTWPEAVQPYWSTSKGRSDRDWVREGPFAVDNVQGAVPVGRASRAPWPARPPRWPPAGQPAAGRHPRPRSPSRPAPQHLLWRALPAHRQTPWPATRPGRGRQLGPDHHLAPAGRPHARSCDLGADFYQSHSSRQRQERNLIRQLQQLTGKTVTLTPDPPPRPHRRSQPDSTRPRTAPMRPGSADAPPGAAACHSPSISSQPRQLTPIEFENTSTVA
jgi:putative endonuclease